MAEFCAYCGKPIPDGGTCTCRNPDLREKADAKPSFFESMKNRMGIGDPELNKGDAFEKGKQIIPECVKANEGEIPIKQYKLATLRSRILGIPYTKAIGRMQVTNKRVIFRAPGRCLAGRTTLQHEFAIDELAGIEARREYVFNAGDLLLGCVGVSLGGILISLLTNGILSEPVQKGSLLAALILTFFTFVFGVVGCIPFFTIKKKWFLKLMCLGGSMIPLLSNGSLIYNFSDYTDYFFMAIFGVGMIALGIISLIITIFCLFIFAIKPNLVLLIKTKSASEAINIKRKGNNPFSGTKDENTGYTEVLPEEDAENCIREINAMINDIQKLGDFGIEKWKA